MKEFNKPVVEKKKPWSRKKRVVTAGYLSAGIFLVAIFIGGGLYVLGRQLGWVERQDIREVVLDQAITDEDLAKAYLEDARQTTCINPAYRFRVTYDKTMPLQQDVRDPACTRFITSNASGMQSTISIQAWQATKEEAVVTVLSGLTGVLTDSWPNNGYDSVLIKGLKNGQEYSAIISMTGEGKTFVIDVYPSDAVSEQRMLVLAESFMIER